MHAAAIILFVYTDSPQGIVVPFDLFWALVTFDLNLVALNLKIFSGLYL
jgi:hypothetical protein